MEGILRITKSDFRQPLNLGSSEMVSGRGQGTEMWHGCVVCHPGLCCMYLLQLQRVQAALRLHCYVCPHSTRDQDVKKIHPALPAALLPPAGEYERDDGDGDEL